jgi:hypothetical protein
MIDDDRLELICKVRQPLRERCGRVGLELPVGDMGEPVSFGLDQCPAGGSEPRVEAKDLQASFSSSSSGTS